MEIVGINQTVMLNSGYEMPMFGLGVFAAKEKNELIHAIKEAVACGYRSIDTAKIYHNEQFVGEALKEIFATTDIKREDLFITSKIWGDDFGSDEHVHQAYAKSLELLGLDYLDLYLIHWPGQQTQAYIDTWLSMEKLYQNGLVKSIGVSNFEPHHLASLFEQSTVIPAVNQVEYHPRLTQKPLHAFLKANGIAMEAWSPLMRGGDLLENEKIASIGAKYGKTNAQIILRWDLQNGVITIPKSVTPSRIRENADIFDFELTAAELAEISSLNENKRLGTGPDEFSFDKK